MRVDESGRVIEWSPQAQAMFGWSPEEAVGRSVAFLVHESAADAVRRRVGFDGMGSLLVKPVLTGSSVDWEVRGSGHAVSDQDLAILQALFAQSPVGLHVLDDQLRIVRMNTATRALRGAPVGRLVGQVFTEAYRLADPQEEETVARQVLESGEPALNRLVRGMRVYGDERRSIYSVSYIRLENADGEVLGLVASAVDVTDRERAQQRLCVLDEVRKKVGERLDVIAACQDLVDAVVPAFSGIAVVEVIEDVVRGEEPPLVPVDRDVPLRRAAFRGRVTAYPVGTYAICRTGPPSHGCCPICARGCCRSTRTPCGWRRIRPGPTPSSARASTP
ncbi:PAS domain-containing protein [Streptomyces sp. MBT84]|uniref:PAS domain-containing protein n=1 Tax=Streptomyces sp. MBT84 TaxID=1488414 RepID=UPI0020769EBD|nr:PAS domain-containing protein [Streptomyces sp. MBT84]